MIRGNDFHMMTRMKAFKRGFFFILGLILLLTSCATAPKPSPSSPVVSPQPDEDVIVKEREEKMTLEKLENHLYDDAYDAYLQGKYENAMHAFEMAKILRPDHRDFWKDQALIYCYLATGYYSKVLTLSKFLIREKPAYWSTYFYKGLAYLWMNNLPWALKNFLLSTEIKDHEPVVHVYLAMAYHMMNKRKKKDLHFLTAETMYRNVIKKNPDDESAYIELAYLYLYFDHDFSQVGELLKKANYLARESENAERKQTWFDFYIPHLQGIYFYKQKEYRRAIITLSEAIEKAPSGIKADLAESLFFIGKSYEGLGDQIKADLFYSKAFQVDRLVLYASEKSSFVNKTRKHH